jgi:hypothetical protein
VDAPMLYVVADGGRWESKGQDRTVLSLNLIMSQGAVMAHDNETIFELVDRFMSDSALFCAPS